MRRAFMFTTICAAAMCAVAGADPVQAVRDAADLDFDLKGMSVTTTGALVESFTVADEDAPPSCVVKAPGSLDITIDLGALGAPAPILVTFTGQEISPGVIRWTTDTPLDVCIPVEFNGVAADVRFRRVQGTLTSQAAFGSTYEGACSPTLRDVELEDVGGNAQNFINIEAYILCFVSPFTRVDIMLRDIDTEAWGGLAAAACPGDLTGDGVVDFDDLAVVLSGFGAGFDFDDLAAVLANFGSDCPG